VIEVPVEPNRLVKKGELLFRIDPTQYQNDLNVAKAKLAADEAKLAQAGAGWSMPRRAPDNCRNS
jgi:multidrug resistance efflux pump